MFEAQQVFEYIKANRPSRVISCILIAERGDQYDESPVYHRVFARKEEKTNGLVSLFCFWYNDMSQFFVDICGNIYWKKDDESPAMESFNIFHSRKNNSEINFTNDEIKKLMESM